MWHAHADAGSSGISRNAAANSSPSPPPRTWPVVVLSPVAAGFWRTSEPHSAGAVISPGSERLRSLRSSAELS